MSTTGKQSERKYGVNEVIIKEGSRGTEFYNINDGRVGIFINYGQESQLKVAELAAGEFFGEAAMLESDSTRSATVTALEPTVLQIVHMDDVNNAIKSNPEVFLSLVKKYYSKQKNQNTELLQLSKLLEDVCEANEDILTLNDQIADFLNEIETISRTYEILGFNARIEAARVGEGGRGFAIMAGELRDLATKTRAIAEQTRGLINTGNENSELSSEKVNVARELLFKSPNRGKRKDKK